MAKTLEQQAGSVVEQLLGVPAADRPAAVVAACGADTPLLDRVRSLLSALPAVDGFMSDATVDGPNYPSVAPVGEKPGDTIGRYKLLEQIGEGGFGVVFTAEQQKPVRRLVAIKVIKLGMDTKEVVARFEAERQALALMDHPNIAKVLDAGATDTGRPYFVMELVRGSAVTEYADKHKLSTRERVALAAQICRAVQHAHSKGVIHRDLKPSNVLVTVADDKPIPKVIDFGIAKATQSRLTDRTLYTAHRQLIGTPQYMSPEQADSDGVDVDTRTDVYSLGVLLYELLVGTTPMDAKQLRSAAFEAMRKMIRDTEVPRPATRLHTMAAESQSAIAASRSTDVKKLSESIRGELDWIVMKALEKDRTRRYETAAALADDLGRYLVGDAVLAGPVSGTYRLRKTLKRYKAAVAVGGAIATVLLLGVAGTTVGLIRARHEAKRADRNRDDAVHERDAADHERTAARELADDFHAQVLLTQKNFAEAAPLLRKAWERRRSFGEDALDTRVALATYAKCLSDDKRRSEAEAAYADAIDADLRAGRGDQPAFAELLIDEGEHAGGDPVATRASYRRAAAVIQVARPGSQKQVDYLMRAVLAGGRGTPDTVQDCRDFIAAYKAIGWDDPNVGMYLYDFANRLRNGGRPEEVTECFRLSLDADHRHPVFGSSRKFIVKTFADHLDRTGDSAAAEKLMADYAVDPVERAEVYFAAGDLPSAKAGYANALHLRPDYDNYYMYTRLCILQGDVDGYRKTCGQMRRRFGRDESFQYREGTARACVDLPPATSTDLEGLADLLDDADANSPPDLTVQSVLTRSLLEYRLGHFDQSRALAFKVKPLLPDWDQEQPDLIAAMALFKSGHAAAAREMLTSAIRLPATTPLKPGVDNFGRLDHFAYMDREILTREARRLITGSADTPDTGVYGNGELRAIMIHDLKTPLDAAVAANPRSALDLAARMSFELTTGDFPAAKSDAARVVAVRHGFAEKFAYVRLCGFLGDAAEYRRVCGVMRRQFGTSLAADEQEGTVRACLMLPLMDRADTDWLKVTLHSALNSRDRTPRVPTLTERDRTPPVPTMTEVLLSYRTAKYANAIDQATEARPRLPVYGQPQATLVIAMAQFQSGHPAEARAALADAEAAMTGDPKPGVDLLPYWLVPFYLDREKLAREAGQLIGPAGGPTSAPGTPTR